MTVPTLVHLTSKTVENKQLHIYLRKDNMNFFAHWYSQFSWHFTEAINRSEAYASIHTCSAYL